MLSKIIFGTAIISYDNEKKMLLFKMNMKKV